MAKNKQGISVPLRWRFPLFENYFPRDLTAKFALISREMCGVRMCEKENLNQMQKRERDIEFFMAYFSALHAALLSTPWRTAGSCWDDGQNHGRWLPPGGGPYVWSLLYLAVYFAAELAEYSPDGDSDIVCVCVHSLIKTEINY